MCRLIQKYALYFFLGGIHVFGGGIHEFGDLLFNSLCVPRPALPKDEDFPARPAERADDLSVAGLVRGDFIAPELDVRLRKRFTLMTVPEATVYEDDLSVPREYEVGTAGQVFSVKSKAVSQAVSYAAD